MSFKDQEKAFLSTFSAKLDDEELLLATLQGMIAAEISIKRQDLGLSQSEFAKKMGVSQSLVSRWENGDTNFTLSTLVSIAAKLNIQMQSPFTPTPSKVYTHGKSNVVYLNTISSWSGKTFIPDSPTGLSIDNDSELLEM